MATDGGPNIERDGLVFGMDTGYGVANNSTSTRFYKGKPTVNYVPGTYGYGMYAYASGPVDDTAQNENGHIMELILKLRCGNYLQSMLVSTLSKMHGSRSYYGNDLNMKS